MTNLQSALTAIEEMVEKHRTTVEPTLKTLGEELQGLVESVGQVRGEIGDLQSSADEAQAEDEDEPPQATEINQNLRERLTSAWYRIRTELERIAADPNRDGRTRAKYGRISRRNYVNLVDSIASDNNLPNVASYRQAARLWATHRNGRAQLTSEEVDSMERYAQVITQHQSNSEE